MLFQKKVDEVDGALPPEVETILIETAEISNDHEAEEDGTAINDTEDEEDEDEPLEEGTREDQWVTATTRAGRISRLPARYRQELNVAALNSLAGRNYYELLIEEDEDDDNANELACVGAGLGGGFENTNELHAMNYKTAMKTPEKKKWKKAVEEEHDRMVKMNVWGATKITDIPNNVKLITLTCAMKKKSNGIFRARVNARGFM